MKEDTNGVSDAFVRDLKTGITERVSVSSKGEQGDAASGCPSLSGGGATVAFSSNATNLAADDELPGPLRFTDAFAHDRKTGKTERVSFSSNTPATARGGSPCGNGGQAISADGRHVVFSSDDDFVIPSDRNGSFDVFVYDRKLRRTERVSVDSTGKEMSQDAGIGAISGNRRFVTLWSNAAYFTQDSGDQPVNNIPPSPTGDPDVFVYDLKTKSVDWVSLTSENKEAVGDCGATGLTGGGTYAESKYPAISFSGRFVGFESCATNLVAGDTNQIADVFVRDRGDVVGVGSLIDGKTRNLEIPAVAASAGSGVAVLPDVEDDSIAGAIGGSEIVGARIIFRPHLKDILAWIDLEDLDVGSAAFSNAQGLGMVYGVSLQIRGIAYELRAAHLDPASRSSRAVFGLFRCSTGSSCTKVANLSGGIGTTGDSVVISVPLSAIGLTSGGTLSEVNAFTGIGSFELGAVNRFDLARL